MIYKCVFNKYLVKLLRNLQIMIVAWILQARLDDMHLPYHLSGIPHGEVVGLEIRMSPVRTPTCCTMENSKQW